VTPEDVAARLGFAVTGTATDSTLHPRVVRWYRPDPKTGEPVEWACRPASKVEADLWDLLTEEDRDADE